MEHLEALLSAPGAPPLATWVGGGMWVWSFISVHFKRESRMYHSRFLGVCVASALDARQGCPTGQPYWGADRNVPLRKGLAPTWDLASAAHLQLAPNPSWPMGGVSTTLCFSNGQGEPGAAWDLLTRLQNDYTSVMQTLPTSPWDSQEVNLTFPWWSFRKKTEKTEKIITEIIKTEESTRKTPNFIFLMTLWLNYWYENTSFQKICKWKQNHR